MLTIFVHKNIPENNLEEEEGHTTAVIFDTLAEFAGKSHDVRNLLNAVKRFLFSCSRPIASFQCNCRTKF